MKKKFGDQQTKCKVRKYMKYKEKKSKKKIFYKEKLYICHRYNTGYGKKKYKNYNYIIFTMKE